MAEDGERRRVLRSWGLRLAVNAAVAGVAAVFAAAREVSSSRTDQIASARAEQVLKDARIAQLEAEVSALRQTVADLTAWRIRHQQFSDDYVDHARERERERKR
jgi:uncharacterized protein YlxW (UPF0749 family)